jgi:hypothetical protein
VGTNKNIDVTGITISGADSNNYNLLNNSDMTSADISLGFNIPDMIYSIFNEDFSNENTYRKENNTDMILLYFCKDDKESADVKKNCQGII